MKLQCRDKECVSRTKNETAAFSVNVVVNDNGEIFENIKNFKGGFFSCVFCHDVAEWVNEENNVLTGASIEYTVKVDEFGNKRWYKNDKLHREDGPACEYVIGTKYWYKNNKRHRIDGPAIELANGSKHWYKNDKLHRIDGPACEYPDGSKEWFLNNKQVTEEDVMKSHIIIIDGKEIKLSKTVLDKLTKIIGELYND